MANILVVEDDLLITRLLRSRLEINEYAIIAVLDVQDALQFALREMPHLILLDDVISGTVGFEITHQLRTHPKTMHIPILMLGNQGEDRCKMRAFEAGVDDYMTRPFHDEELLARIRVQLRHMQQGLLSPLTGLPGGLQVEQAIKYHLGRPDPWSILYLDLDNFKAFNDAYGFLAGNSLIRLVGRICQHTVREYGNTEDFVGHIGGDDFVIMTTPNCVQPLSSRIVARYREESIVYYRPEDRERGSISGVDRKGRPYQFPLVSLSIGEVSNQIRQPHSMQEMSYLTAEAKYLAKQSSGNIYHTAPRREKIYYERPHSALSQTSAPLPPFLSGHLHYDLLHLLDGEAQAEIEQHAHR